MPTSTPSSTSISSSTTSSASSTSSSSRKVIGAVIALLVGLGGFVLIAPVVLIGAIVGAADAAGCYDATTGVDRYAGELDEVDTGDGGEQGLRTVTDLNASQEEHARTIIDVGRNLDRYSFDGGSAETYGPVTDGAIVVALTVALTETRLRNYANDGVIDSNDSGGMPDDVTPEQLRESLDYPHDAVGTDHASVGLFQQQVGWWGTVEVLMQPENSAATFYAALLEVDGWETLSVGQAAQRVQVSAVPDAYDTWEPLAREILATFGAAGSEEALIDGTVICGGAIGMMECAPTGLAVEEGLKPNALRVLRCVAQEFGSDRWWAGVADRANNPTSNHPQGLGVDVGIPDFETDEGNAAGWLIADWLQANAQVLGVSEIIWDDQIWTVQRADEGWREHTRAEDGGSATARHLDHVHVSVFETAVAGSETSGPIQGVEPGEIVNGWAYPVDPDVYRVTAYWHSYPGHTGTDLAAPLGTPVRAATAGKVYFAAFDTTTCYGNLVKINHQGVPGVHSTYYAHLDSIAVTADQQVQAGQVIGYMGSSGRQPGRTCSTGSHLHFEVRTQYNNPVDAEPFMAARGLPLR